MTRFTAWPSGFRRAKVKARIDATITAEMERAAIDHHARSVGPLAQENADWGAFLTATCADQERLRKERLARDAQFDLET